MLAQEACNSESCQVRLLMHCSGLFSAGVTNSCQVVAAVVSDMFSTAKQRFRQRHARLVTTTLTLCLTVRLHVVAYAVAGACKGDRCPDRIAIGSIARVHLLGNSIGTRVRPVHRTLQAFEPSFIGRTQLPQRRAIRPMRYPDSRQAHLNLNWVLQKPVLVRKPDLN